MKAYFVVNLCICLALLGGTVFFAQKVDTTTKKLAEFEEESKRDIRKLNDQLSATLTRMGRLQGNIQEMKERVEALSDQGASAEMVEKMVQQAVAEERERRRRRRPAAGEGAAAGGERAAQDQTRREAWGRMFGEQMPPQQRELVQKMREDGRKDWEALQKKVEAGEVTREEAQRQVFERIGSDIQKFMKSLQGADEKKEEPEEPVEKPAEKPEEKTVEEKPVEKPLEKEETPQPDPKKGDDKPVPPGT